MNVFRITRSPAGILRGLSKSFAAAGSPVEVRHSQICPERPLEPVWRALSPAGCPRAYLPFKKRYGARDAPTATLDLLGCVHVVAGLSLVPVCPALAQFEAVPSETASSSVS